MCELSRETIDHILENGRIFEVGGVVRDRMLFDKPPVKDRDYLVTGIPFSELSTILRRHGKVDLVGQSFGVIKFTQFSKGKPHTFDIALPRREHSTGVGHKDFEVAFDPGLSVQDDLHRRDFTVNAMAVALDNNELIDPLGGQVDLSQRCLRMVYPKSFEDDPLRMLRAIQFAARFEFLIEPNTFAALRRNSGLIATVSPERIAEELGKLVGLSRRPSEGFRLMQATCLLKEIIPELEATVGVDQPGGYHAYDVFEHTLRTIDACPPRLRLRLAALFHDIRKPQAKRVTDTGATFYGHEVTGARTAQKVLRRLRFSNELIDDVHILVHKHMFTTDVSDKGLRRLIRRVGVERIFDLLDLRRADVIGQGMGGTTEDVDQLEADIRAELDRKPPFCRSDLAINGADVMKIFDLVPGPDVGRILDHLMEAVLDDPADNRRDRLEEIARYFFDNNINSISDKGSMQ